MSFYYRHLKYDIQKEKQYYFVCCILMMMITYICARACVCNVSLDIGGPATRTTRTENA